MVAARGRRPGGARLRAVAVGSPRCASPATSPSSVAGLLAAVLWRRAARGRPGRALAAARRRAAAPGPGRPALVAGPRTRWPPPGASCAGRRPCPATSRDRRDPELVDRQRLRAGPGLAVEVALFLAACLVVVHLLVVGPDGAGRLRPRRAAGPGRRRPRHLRHHGRRADPAGVIEAARSAMALVLLAGTVLLTGGRGLGHLGAARGHAARRGRQPVPHRRRPAGCSPSPSCSTPRPAPPRTTEVRRGDRLGQLLPHLALLRPWSPSGGVAVTGVRPGAV